MHVAFQDAKAKQFAAESSLFHHLKRRKFVISLVVRFDRKDNLRIFLREEIGKVQHVVWLSEEELREWINSPIESHFHFTKPRTGSRKKE